MTEEHKAPVEGSCDCGACAATAAAGGDREAGMKAHRVEMQAKIDKYGIAIVGVEGDPESVTPPIAMTIGMTDKGLPEFILQGLNPKLAAGALNHICHEIINGERVAGEHLITEMFNLPLQIVEVTSDYVVEVAGSVFNHYDGSEHKPKFMQVILCDKEGKFPWDEGFDNAEMDIYQCVMGKPAAVTKKICIFGKMLDEMPKIPEGAFV